MKSKKTITIIILLTVIFAFIMIASVKPIKNYLSDRFWDFVCYQLDKEESERMEKIANGEIVGGKDTILIWENMYVIGHYSNGNHLTIEADDTNKTLLRRIADYSVYGEKLYVISYEGYAVIDRNRQCRIYITVPLKDFEEEKEYGINEKGERLFYTGKAENEYVTYIENFSDYSESEQKIIEKMIKKN